MKQDKLHDIIKSEYKNIISEQKENDPWANWKTTDRSAGTTKSNKTTTTKTPSTTVTKKKSSTSTKKKSSTRKSKTKTQIAEPMKPTIANFEKIKQTQVKIAQKKEYQLAKKIAEDLVDKVYGHSYDFFNEFQNSRYAGGIIAMDDSYGAYKKIDKYYKKTWVLSLKKLEKSKFKWSRMNADILKSAWNFSINTIYENDFQLRKKDYPEFQLYYLSTDRPGSTRYIHPWQYLSG